MIPDKIFKHLTTGNHLLNGQYCECKPAKIRYDDEIIEYIRKDTLLKCVKDLKAQMGIEASGCSNLLAAGEWLAYDKLIKKIELM